MYRPFRCSNTTARMDWLPVGVEQKQVSAPAEQPNKPNGDGI